MPPDLDQVRRTAKRLEYYALKGAGRSTGSDLLHLKIVTTTGILPEKGHVYCKEAFGDQHQLGALPRGQLRVASQSGGCASESVAEKNNPFSSNDYGS